jgi:hypothetical protein
MNSVLPEKMSIRNRSFMVFAAISDNLVPNHIFFKVFIKKPDYRDSSVLAGALL